MRALKKTLLLASTLFLMNTGLTLAANPIVHFSFDGSVFDPSQLYVDSSGNGYHATIAYGAPEGSADVPISLFPGNSWDSPGVGDAWMDMASGLPKPSGNYSIALWVKSLSGGVPKVIATTLPPANGIELWYRADDTFRYYHNGVVVIDDLQAGVVYDPINWTHLAVTVDVSAGTVILYVNGVERCSTTGLSLSPLIEGLERIGGNFEGASNRGYNGKLDDFRFYDYVLTQQEVTTLYGENSADTITFVMQAPDGTKIPKVVGGGGDPVPDTGYDYLEWFGITHHRTWFRPSIATLPDDSLVNTSTKFNNAIAAIRQNPWLQATASDYYIDWAHFNKQFTDPQISAMNRVTSNELERVIGLGIEPMIANSTFISDTNPLSNWPDKFSYWKSWYAMVYFMASKYDITKYQFKNEPHAWVDYDVWESHWLVAADAMRKAMDDVNTNYGKSLVLNICGPVETGDKWDYSATNPDSNDGDGWGSLSWVKIKYDMYGNYDVNNPWNYGSYDFHRYMDIPIDLQLRVMNARNGIANANNDPHPDIPIILSEINTRSSIKFQELDKDSEDQYYGVGFAPILQCLPALGPNGLGDEGGFYAFKLGSGGDATDTPDGIENRLCYASPNLPGNYGGITRGGAVFQMYAKHFSGGKSIVPFNVTTGGQAEHRMIAVVDPEKNFYYIYGSNFTGSQPDVVVDLSALDVSAGESVTLQLVDANKTGQITDRLTLDGSKKLHFTIPDMAAYLITVPKGSTVLTQTVIEPIEDTMQYVNDPTVNHGAKETMQVATHNRLVSPRSSAFMRYTVNNVDTMSRALLKVSGRNIGDDQNLREIVHVYAVANENWSEDSPLTWTSAPGVGKYYIDSNTMGSADGKGDMIDIEDNYAGFTDGAGKGLGIYGQFIGALSFYSNAYATNYLDVTDYIKSVASGSSADVTFVVVRIVRYNVNNYNNPYYYNQGSYHYNGRIVELASKENSDLGLRPAIIVMEGSGGENGTLVELFSDGFENGFSPIWNSSAFLSGTSYEGAKAAKMNNSDSVETSIDTTGYSDILVTYARETENLQAGSSFVSEWYDGTGWNTIEQITSGFSAYELVSQVALPSGADNNPNFRLRFLVNTVTNDYAIVDAVVVEGVSSDGLVGYDLWASTYGVGGSGTETNDFDSDGKNNFYEYVMGGNPTDAQDLGKPVEFTKNGNEFIYVHPQNLDDSSLIYTVESTGNLFDPNSWAIGVYTVSGTNLIDGIGYVSNVVNMTEDKIFIRTKVEKQ